MFQNTLNFFYLNIFKCNGILPLSLYWYMAKTLNNLSFEFGDFIYLEKCLAGIIQHVLGIGHYRSNKYWSIWCTFYRKQNEITKRFLMILLCVQGETEKNFNYFFMVVWAKCNKTWCKYYLDDEKWINVKSTNLDFCFQGWK